MTTIAWNSAEQVMACDSCWTASDGAQQTSESKIARLASGGLLGQAGDNDSRAVVALFDSVKSERQLPTKEQLAATKVDFAGIFVMPKGKVYLVAIGYESDRTGWDGQLWPSGRFGFAAVGSGSHLALIAMRCKKSARQAVVLACDYDNNSKVPVHVVPLKPYVNPRVTRSKRTGK